MQELTELRGVNSKHFVREDGAMQMDAHIGHLHYFNKLGFGDGEKRWREIDFALQWDETKRGWTFKFHNFVPFLPEYADGTVEFWDLYEEKDQIIRFSAQCGHIKGELLTEGMLEAEGLDKLTQQNCVIYRDAFGEGKDYILYFTRTQLCKVVRIREAYKGSSSLEFEFEVDFPKAGGLFLPVLRASAENNFDDGYSLDIDRPKIFDSNKQVLIGIENEGGDKEWKTYLRTFSAWDDVRRVTINVSFYQAGDKRYFRKIVDGEFLRSSQGDVFTDTTTSYYAGSGDGRIENSGTVWSTVRSASTGGFSTYTESDSNNYFQCYKTGSTYIICRNFYPIDTSGIGSGNNVDSATFRFWLGTKTPNTDSVSAHLIATSQASTSSLSTSDFGSVTLTSLGSKSISGATTGAYNDITVGDLTKINKTGFSKLGITLSPDMNNSAPTGANYFETNFSEYTGTSRDPYVSVTYSAAPIRLNRMTLLGCA